MNKFEELNNKFRESGFDIDGNKYTLDNVTYQKVNINGDIRNIPHHNIFAMEYIGEGCEVGDSDEIVECSEFYEFNIMDDDEVAATICIHDFEELNEFINMS